MPPDTKSTLEEIRRRIDLLDDQIHDALMARAELVAAVRTAKTGDRPIFRPGREASVLRRLVTRHRGQLPAPVIVQLWRQIMTASSRLQGAFSIAVTTSAAGGTAIELARAHFGGLAPLHAAGSVRQALKTLAEGRAQLAIVPLPEDAPGEPWWAGFGRGADPGLHVLARLPVMNGPPDRRAALAVARQDFDRSDEDRGYVIAETSIELSQTRLKSAFERAGLEVIAFPAALDEHGAGSAQLVELAAYVASDDPRIATAQAVLGVGARLRAIGGYAVPMALPGG
jgi:chorismate mutase